MTSKESYERFFEEIGKKLTTKRRWNGKTYHLRPRFFVFKDRAIQEKNAYKDDGALVRIVKRSTAKECKSEYKNQPIWVLYVHVPKNVDIFL
jgi:hypothetical protein